MGRRAKNKQKDPEPLVLPVKDATNKPPKTKSTSSRGSVPPKAARSSPVKRKAEKIESLEKEIERPAKKVKLDGKSKPAVAKEDKAKNAKPLIMQVPEEYDDDSGDDDESEGWDGIPDGVDLSSSKKYVRELRVQILL